MKRRLLAMLVVTILGMSLITGCDSNTNTPDPTQTTAAQTTQPTTTPESTEPAETTAAKPARLITEEITSVNIADHNLVGDPGAEEIYIYLPPDYYDSQESYPVVYYFHGHGETPGSFLRGSKSDLDNFFSEGEQAFIMVEVSGNGYTNGSFYVDSPSSGNWESCLIEEIIPYVDGEYRTLAQAESRGICGFSMGGFGAMNLALRHPDVFAAVYSMSPGIMKDDALPEAIRGWATDKTFLESYARAFAPNPENTEIFGDIPVMDNTDADNLIAAKWLDGFGNWSQKLDAYLSLGTPLQAIGISYGTEDGYPWISTGSAYFVDLLRENGIEPTVFAFDGGHSMPPSAIADHLGPFFMENLAWE